ncbi:MAG: amidohydrolase family protein [Gemmatimonadetes bacterium]|nr:amidohydrolase family protein [Gemmatimonadota bacterium]
MVRIVRLFSAALLAAAAPAAAQTVAITNAKLYTGTGTVIDGGTVVFRDGRITAVGAVGVPAGARVIDAAGKVVTPGFLDSSTQVGVVEIGQYEETRDEATADDRITAAFNVADGINPRSTLIPVTRVEGITRVVVAPGSGSSLIAGQGVLMDLSGDPLSVTLHRNPVAMFAVLGETGAALAGGARSAALLRLREALQDARDYLANREAFETNRRRDYAISRLDLEALAPLVRGELPLAVRADRASDLLAAARFAQESGVRIVLLGAAEGWMVAGELARAGVAVVINPMQNLPGFDNLGATLENAARLHAAGVTVAFATFDAHNSRNLKQAAGNAVAYGMPWEAALRAVTATPARIWGVADRFGTIEVGKDADLVVWSGDPFELSTAVEHVFIRGREMPKDNRQRELFQRYRAREALPQAYDH